MKNEKQLLRERITRDIDAFLAKGGKINQVSPGASVADPPLRKRDLKKEKASHPFQPYFLGEEQNNG